MNRRALWGMWLLAVVLTAPLCAGPADDALSAGIKELAAGQTDNALKQFNQAIGLDPALLAARFYRAKCLARQEKWAEAVVDLNAVLAKKADSAASWIELARYQIELGQVGDAGTSLERGLAIEPASPAGAEVKRLLASRSGARTSPDTRLVSGPQGVYASALPIGPRVAVNTEGVAIEETAIGVDGQRVLDYTFGTAPTDWVPAGGKWEVTNRYACEPDWNFFGGQSRGLCAIWNKRRLDGDVLVEAYVAFKHGLPWADGEWYYVPSDLNINLASDFNNLDSGYSFIYSGRNGSTTMIRRGEKVLAQTRDVDKLLPQFTDANPLFGQDDQGREFGKFHRHWWRLEARRTGDKLRFSVDGKLVLEATDPNPARTGHVALWTVGSGMVVARMRIAFNQELRPLEPKVVVRQATPIGEGATQVAAR
ncbi:MAG: hypothetical protein HZB16_17185 [Armatimonadetes bacterium]|nr:hypothetical protein [Armatimonadota bacterium]